MFVIRRVCVVTEAERKERKRRRKEKKENRRARAVAMRTARHGSVCFGVVMCGERPARGFSRCSFFRFVLMPRPFSAKKAVDIRRIFFFLQQCEISSSWEDFINDRRKNSSISKSSDQNESATDNRFGGADFLGSLHDQNPPRSLTSCVLHH